MRSLFTSSTRRPAGAWRRLAIILLIVALLAAAGGIFLLRQSYTNGLKPVSNSQKEVLFTIPQGTSVQAVAQEMHEKGLIRSARSFEWYFRTNGLRTHLQAGTYSLRPNMSVAEIADIVTQGKIATDLITILPGKRIDEIRSTLINNGFSPTAVDKALDPNRYANHPALVDKPDSASLEGYVYPESFQKSAETSPETIIRASLDEMQKVLTPQVRAGFVKQGLTVHQGIILSSIVENEVHSPEDKAKAAQVFLKRLREGIHLQSDATSAYGAILEGGEPSLTYESAYNTYNHGGLTPTPISNVTKESVQAVAQPAKTDFLYFVSGDTDDNGVSKTYFSKTLDEHEANVKKYCTKLCQGQ